MSERLQKLIAESGLCSRREAERRIAAGRVTLNGLPASLGMSGDRERDRICVDGKPLAAPPAKLYIMLNKPRGYLSALRDDRGRRTVAELTRDAGQRLYPVGRLDLESDGLLLMTNDGDLTTALTHPSHEVDKRYRTRVKGDLLRALPLLTSPMVIDGYAIRPARVEVTGPDTMEITIHEGRNRQVRKMCRQAGLEVLRLTRIAEGPLRLGSLKPGTWRYLKKREIAALKSLVSKEESRPYTCGE